MNAHLSVAPETLGQKKWRGLNGLILLFLGLTILAIRWLTYSEPLERDLTTYAVIAHEMLNGRPLYADVWDIKPPGIYMLYEAAEMLAGYGPSSIFLLGVGAAVATLLGIYKTVAVATGDKLAALWASFFWVLVCSDIDLQANQPNTEVFINAAFVWGLMLFIRAYRDRLEKKWPLLAAGCIWGAVSLVKQITFLTPLLLALVLISLPRPLALKTRLQGVASLLAPTVAAWLLTMAYFGLTFRWQIFSFTMFDVGRLYLAQNKLISASLPLGSRIAPPTLFFLWPLLALFCFGVASNYKSKLWWILGLSLLAIDAEIYLPGAGEPHYFQLLLPLICLAAGFAVAQWRAQKRAPLLASGLATLAVVALFVTQWPHWKLSPDEVSVRKYGPQFTEQFAVAPQLAAMLKPDESFYEYGYDSAFYFVTKRRPPVGVLGLGRPGIKFPGWFHEKIMADLDREKPQMVMIDRNFPPTPVLLYINQNYQEIPDWNPHDGFILMARKNGALSKRLGVGRG